jgi:hypothetical protein
MDSVSAGITDRELYERRRGRLFGIAARIMELSNLFRLLVGDPQAEHEQIIFDSSRPRVPEEDRWYLLQRLHSTCRQRGIRLVVIVPWYRSFQRHAELLRRFGRESGVPVVDLPARLGHLSERDRFFADAVHPTAEGHRLISETLAAALEEMWVGNADSGGHRSSKPDQI